MYDPVSLATAAAATSVAFTPLQSAIGGAVLGVAVAGKLRCTGRVLGISGTFKCVGAGCCFGVALGVQGRGAGLPGWRAVLGVAVAGQAVLHRPRARQQRHLHARG